MADIKYIFTDLGDLDGQAGKYVRTRSDEKQLEFHNVRDNEWDRCSVTKSADQTVSATTWTSVTWNQESFDVGGMHDNSTNNTRITIQEAGLYRIFYQVKTEANDKTAYKTRILKNGTTELKGSCNELEGSKDTSFLCLNSVCPLYQFAVNDYIEVQYYHNDGTTQDVQSANSFFEVLQIFTV